MAVVEASGCNLHLTPGLGTSMCHRCGPEKQKKSKKKRGGGGGGIMGVPTVVQQDWQHLGSARMQVRSPA